MAYWIMKAIISPFLLLLWRVRVEGREHVRHDGPVILAANHQSFCDSFFLPVVVRRRVTYVAKAEYFDSWKTAWFFRAAGQIPMNRSGGDASQRALDTATSVLQGGGVLAIYPEGTRAPDTRLHKGKTGVARLSLGCNVPVIPVGIIGTRNVQPPGSMFMRPFRSVTVRFGSPVSYELGGATITTGQCAPVATPGGTARVELDQDGLRALTDALMADIASLSGQEYVDVYASRKRRAPGEGGVPATPAPSS
ncbi:MAG TPA: lysophospholipid acyltransferase family protein [Acidimicrobiales bacterium]